MLVEKLFQSGFVKVASVSQLLAYILCDPLRKDCVYRVCAKCCYKDVEIAPQEQNTTTTWLQWERVKTTSGEKEFTNFVKKAECVTWQDLQRILNEKLDLLAKHQYNWIHQVEQCRQVKETISDTEVVVHMDFSENYGCKLHTEIQAFHFGRSRKGYLNNVSLAFRSFC